MAAQLNLSQAKQAVGLAIESLKQPQNAEELKNILNQCMQQPDPMAQFQMKMTKLIPKVSEILGADIQRVLGVGVEPGQVMGYVMQIQALAMTDLALGVQVGKIMKTLGGDFSGLYEEEAEEELEEVE